MRVGDCREDGRCRDSRNEVRHLDHVDVHTLQSVTTLDDRRLGVANREATHRRKHIAEQSITLYRAHFVSPGISTRPPQIAAAVNG